MFSLGRVDRKLWPVRILAHGLLLAILSLSLHFEHLTQAGATPVSPNSVAKVRKYVKTTHGARPEIALATTWAQWTVSFPHRFLSVVYHQDRPGWHLLNSVIIRAPPCNDSV